jgi:hypothetical protein
MDRKLKSAKKVEPRIKGRDYPQNHAFESEGCDCQVEPLIEKFVRDEEADKEALDSF